MPQIKAETLSEMTGVIVGLGLSFAVGKWIFGEDVGNLLHGWDRVAKIVVVGLALLLPMFQAMTLVEKLTQRPWAVPVWGGVAGVVSGLVLMVGMTIGASLDAQKHIDLADANARAQLESKRQYERLNEAFRAAIDCRTPD
ncbi:hypothetical protein [Stenotrophomonas sp. YAU14A_MKIMI4_1]|uniref:hypothetical protein n=1 Tax=Stenotrophomonas sp. YAU14A_MKIMI4_1 TaxID=2072408 RepID=UPI000D53D7ED|nr:hypothetical protein [Stenotrophomonas sp. YAU14A_MKIMI4_1]AWH29886.1 hypothetical protein C1931_13730 [Stenotrophomonas sp. YAU14A_MKIMI4_1]